MLNVLLAGVGGQGTVLAAKVLAQAAQKKGWQVRTAETIGMAQRGGSVVSHVRMGNNGEEIFAPLIAHGTANLAIAFEPAEGARAMSYLAPGATLVTATTGIQPVTAALAQSPYQPANTLDYLRKVFPAGDLVEVDDAALLARIGNQKALNTVLLAAAFQTKKLPFTMDDLRESITVCVKPRFVELNLQAIKIVEERG